MSIQRHDLIEEAKAELDCAYEAVKQAENRLIALDVEFGQKISAAKKSNGAKMPEKIEKFLARCSFFKIVGGIDRCFDRP